MSSATLQIGVVQFDIAWENREANITHLQSILRFDEPVDLLLLPEMWSTGFSMRPEVIAEEVSESLSLAWMIEQSQNLNISIAGSLSISEDGKYYNRWYCVHPSGQIDHYDKRHLFSYGKENDHYTAGDKRIVIDVKGWKIMPIICYDLRFPVWCRNNLDYDVMIVAANWPTPRIHHWDALLQARAIENQSYISAVNRIGSDGNDLHFPGHSSIYDMNGVKLLDMKDNEGIGIFSLDRLALTRYREHYRFLQDRDAFRL